MADFPQVPVDVDRARAFVLAHGGLREQARLAGILEGAKPDREVAKELEELQNKDGGFPFQLKPGFPSSVDTTCYVLAQLKDMPPLAGAPMASRAVAFLRRVQETNGSWKESAAVASVGSPWSQPSNPFSGAYLTANALFSVHTLEPDHVDPVLRGERWLRTELDRLGYRVFAQTLGLAAAVGYRLGHAESLQMADRCVQAFTGQEPLEVAWFLSAAVEGKVPAKWHGMLQRMLEYLAECQDPHDGCWPAEEGYETEATLTALRALKGFGQI